MSKEFNLEDYQRNIIEQIRKEADENNSVRKRVCLVTFTSYSAGRGKRRDPRIVSLLVVDNSYAYVVNGHEIKPRKNNDHVALDVLANEVLAPIPHSERSVDKLLEMATPRQNSRSR